MSHVADGELHAYLDGALDLYPGDRAAEVREHLADCPSCRRRLEEEEALRERATAVLAGSGPDRLAAPPLESLKARAREAPAGGGARPPRRVPAHLRVAWAASVVVALGAGWLAREVAAPPTSESGTATRALAPAEEATGLSGVARVAPGDGRAVPARDGSAQEGRVGRGGGAPADLAGAVGEERDAGGADEVASARIAPPPADPAPSEPVASGLRGAGRARAAAPPPEERTAARVEAAGERAEGDSAGAVAVDAAALQEEAVAVDEVVVTGVPAATGDPAAEDVAARQADEAPRSLELERRADPGRRQASAPGEPAAAGAEPAVAAPTTEPEAREGAPIPSFAPVERPTPVRSTSRDRDEPPPLAVPGRPVVALAWEDVHPGIPALRVLQLLEGGADTLELRFVGAAEGGRSTPGPDEVAAAVEALMATPPRPGWSRAARPHGDGWVVASAPVDAVTLEALLGLLADGGG